MGIKRVAAVAAVMLGSAAFAVATTAPVTALPDGWPLVCDANDPLRPANGTISALGSSELGALEQAEFVPRHEARCPQTAGAFTYTDAPEWIAISALQQRTMPGANPRRAVSYIGVNQPLSTSDRVRAIHGPIASSGPGTLSPVHHLPLMIDGFVVTADVPCPNPSGQRLRLSALTLSLLYSGAITTWTDPVLLRDNAWLTGCAASVGPTVSVRTGGAWSTATLKDYMAKANPVYELYERRERLDEWPGQPVVGCWGATEAGMVACASRPGSISYLRYATAKAHGLARVELTNGSGAVPAPALDPADTWPSGCPAAVPSRVDEPRTTLGSAGFLMDWSTFSMTNGTGYPLCAFSYVVTPQHPSWWTSPAERDARRDHLRVMWFSDTQQQLKDHGYAPLPEFLRLNVQNAQVL